MVSRREFLQRSAAVSLAGLAPISFLGDGSKRVPASTVSELLYLGKPADYWLGHLYGDYHNPEFPDDGNGWIVQFFGEEVVPRLIESLKQRDDCTCAGITELQFLASPRTVEHLVVALEHSDPKIRKGALEALMGISMNRIPRPEIVEPLKNALPAIAAKLRDSNPRVCQMAAHFLATEGSELDPSFVVPIDGLKGREAANREGAVKMLGKRTAEEAVPLLEEKLNDPDCFVRWKAAEQLSHFDPDHSGIVPVFVDYLVKRRQITAIGYAGLDRIILKALPLLQEALKTADSLTRSSIVHGLQWSRSDCVLPTLEEMLEDDNAEVRAMAVNAAMPLLIKAAEDESDLVQREVRRLARLSAPAVQKAIPELVNVLEHGKPFVRASIMLLLVELGPSGIEAIPRLRQQLQDSDRDVQLAAAIAVSHIEPANQDLCAILLEGLEHKESDISDKADKALQNVDLSAIRPKLVESFKNNSFGRTSAKLFAKIVAEVAKEAPVAYLLDRLTSKETVPHCVLELLAADGSKALPLLVGLLEHEEAFVRARAIKTIGLMGNEASAMIPPFIRTLNTGSALERVAAAEALGKIGPTLENGAVDALRTAIKDRDIAIWLKAIVALGKSREQAECAIPELCGILKGPSSLQIKWKAARVLRKIGKPAVPVLLQCLKNGDDQLRRLIAKELSERV